MKHDSHQNIASFFQALLLTTLLASFATALLMRLYVVNSVFGHAANCEGCFHWMVFSADAWYLAILLFSTWLSFLAKNYFVALTLRVLVLIGLAVYCLDVAITLSFATRLNLADLQVYSQQVGLLWQHINDAYELQWWHIVATIIGALWVLAAFAWKYPRLGQRSHHLALLVPSFLLFLGGFSTSSLSYVRKPAFKNVLTAAWPGGEYQNYSDATIQRVLEVRDPLSSACHRSSSRRDDIILLILESWSPYQSALLTGLNNWTPKLDRLALENAYYSDLIAAGYTTNLGLMSILAGQPLTISIVPRRVFPGTWGLSDTLPLGLRRYGYHPAFLTSGDLAFTRKGEWLADIGFVYIEGHDYPGYTGIKRLHFRSVPDHLLYQRSLEYLDEAPKDKPLFLAIESVSTHQPFMHPETRERDIEAVFRYMDNTVFEFYEGLAQRGFFEHGILLIVSDHRSMTPIFPQEQAALGRKAASLVPMILIDGSGPGVRIDAPLHQADIAPSLLAFAGEYDCPGEASIWPDAPKAERCRFHVRGDQRNLIDVSCHDGEGTVALAGDESRFVHAEQLSESRQHRILDDIARLRLTAQQHDDAFEE